jgi:hypothetical protein
MSVYTLEQLSGMMDALTTRVNNIDGQNLTLPAQGSIAINTAKVNGLNTSVKNLVSNFQGQILKLSQLINNR